MANARAGAAVLVVALAFGTAGCEFPTRHREVAREAGAPTRASAGGSPVATGSAGGLGLLPGVPPLLDPQDVYAADRPGRLSPRVRDDPALAYVPNSRSNTVAVVDQRTHQVVRRFRYSLGHTGILR
jgi:hypothetical protein